MITSCNAPVWSRLMSSRLPIRWLSRSAPSSIVSSNSWVASGPKSTSCCSRLLTEALIDDSGVRRSCDTAASNAVRSSFASSSVWVRADAARSSRCSTAVKRHGRRKPAGCQARPGARPDPTGRARRCPAVRPRAGLVFEASGTSRRKAGTVHAPSSPQSTDTGSAAKAARTCATSAGSGSSSTVKAPFSAASVSASGRARAASTERRAAMATEQLTTPPTTRKITGPRGFSPSRP